MTETDFRPLNGQDIGQAERATRAVLDRLLDDTGTRFHQWVALNLIATSPQPIECAEVADRMVQGLKIDAAAATDTVEDLIRIGLVEIVGRRVGLTGVGENRFARIRGGIAAITRNLYGDIPVDDLVTAHRVLRTVIERANLALAH
jgi:hypothetical protein